MSGIRLLKKELQVCPNYSKFATLMVNPCGLNEKFAIENLTYAQIIVHEKNEEEYVSFVFSVWI